MFGGGVFGGGGGMFGEFGAQDAEAGEAMRPHPTTASILANSPHSQAQGSFHRQKPQLAPIPDSYAIVSVPPRRVVTAPIARPATARFVSPLPVRPGVVRAPTLPRSPVGVRPAIAPAKRTVAAPTYTGWKPPAATSLPAQLIAKPVPPLRGFGEDAASAAPIMGKIVLGFAIVGVLTVGARLLDL